VSRERPIRRRSESLPPPMSKIPLRDCCKACMPIVDAFLAEPSTPERMTKGALRIKRSDCHGGFHPGDLVKVDELDAVTGEASHLRSGGDSVVMEETQDDVAQEIETLALRSCWDDGGDEKDLFPLPSPRNSPQGSPSASQTNLASVCESPTIVHHRRASPLSNCYQMGREGSNVSSHTDPGSPGCEEISLVLSRTRSASESSTNSHRKGRRPSLSSIGENVSKGGAVVFRGLAGVVAGGNRGGGLVAL
jgi:hypothetical protein